MSSMTDLETTRRTFVKAAAAGAAVIASSGAMSTFASANESNDQAQEEQAMSKHTYLRTPEEVRTFATSARTLNNNEGVWFSWETDIDAIASILPKPLEPTMGVAACYAIRIGDPTFCMPYYETNLMFPVTDGTNSGIYPISLLLKNGENGLFGGRDRLGIPKKTADDFVIRRIGDDVKIEVVRQGCKIVDLEMDVCGHNDPELAPKIFSGMEAGNTAEAHMYFFKYDWNEGMDGTCEFDNLRMYRYLTESDYIEWEPASITKLELGESANDPWCMFPVNRFIGGAWCKFNLREVKPIEVVELEASDEEMGKLIANKFDGATYGVPNRIL